MLAKALATLSPIEAKAVWNALAQYVENNRDAVEYACEAPDPETAADFAAAEDVLERLDAAIAAGGAT